MSGPGTMQSSATNDQMEWKLRKDKQVWKGTFSNGDPGTKLFDDIEAACFTQHTLYCVDYMRELSQISMVGLQDIEI